MDGYTVIGDAIRWVADEASGEIGSLAARLALAGLFGVAAIHKLRHPLIAAAAAANFGVIRHATARAGRAIGGVELATAAILVAVPLPEPVIAACLVAGLLSLAFLAVTVRALARDERFPCHCLSSGDEAISPVTALRAAAMLLAAAAGAAGALRGYVFPSGEQAVQAIGLSACATGLPIAVHASLTQWRRHIRFMRETDWEWVLHGSHQLDGSHR